MSADDQAFLDVLNSVPRHLKHFSDDVADYIEAHVDKVASTLRETLSHADWLPESARPRPPPKPISLPQSIYQAPSSLYTRSTRWLCRNKLLTGTFVVGLSAGLWMVARRKADYVRKRRARRSANGARMEVVVIAGPISDPMIQSLTRDLERRGFIVYIVCDSASSERLVKAENKPHIRPLRVNVLEPAQAKAAVKEFTESLSTPQYAFDGAYPHRLTLAALLVFPSPTYPSAPLATLSAHTLTDLVNTRLFNPIMVTQLFLPLLTDPPRQSVYDTARPRVPKVVLLTPAITSSLQPAFSIPESSMTAALSGFASALELELEPLGVSFSHMKLGAFNVPQSNKDMQLVALSGRSAETRNWSPEVRDSYGKNFLRSAKNSINGSEKGSNMRELYNAVFDIMDAEGHGPRSVFVGRGAWTWSVIGAVAPRGLVGWMMGTQQVRKEKVGDEEKAVPAPNVSESFTSTGSDDEPGEFTPDSSEFISME